MLKMPVGDENIVPQIHRDQRTSAAVIGALSLAGNRHRRKTRFQLLVRLYWTGFPPERFR